MHQPVRAMGHSRFTDTQVPLSHCYTDKLLMQETLPTLQYTAHKFQQYYAILPTICKLTLEAYPHVSMCLWPHLQTLLA